MSTRYQPWFAQRLFEGRAGEQKQHMGPQSASGKRKEHRRGTGHCLSL